MGLSMLDVKTSKKPHEEPVTEDILNLFDLWVTNLLIINLQHMKARICRKINYL